MFKHLVLFALFLAVSACGPTDGDGCTPNGAAFGCGPNNSVQTCENATVTSFACPGPTHCTNTGGKNFYCDFRGIVVGSKCPTFAVGKGTCADDKTMATCGTDLKWAGRACPASCSMTTDQVLCN